jgi:hypothetical protein
VLKSTKVQGFMKESPLSCSRDGKRQVNEGSLWEALSKQRFGRKEGGADQVRGGEGMA